MRNRYKILRWLGACISTLLIPLLLTSAQAQNGGWRVISAQPLAELLQNTSTTPEHVFPAPTGDRIAYETITDDSEHGLCVVLLTTGAETCTHFPKESAYAFGINEFYPPLAWSPDGTQIALVGMPYQRLKDTDLGLLRDSMFVPLIDDGFAGRMLRVDPTSMTYSVEIQPTFSPDGTQIAVEQTVFVSDSGNRTTTISLIDATTGNIEVLSTVPVDDPAVAAGTIVSMAWSPDSSTLALSLVPFDRDDTHNGVWLLDIASGELTSLLTVDDGLAAAQLIYPEYDSVWGIAPLLWSPDGSRLLFWTGDPEAVSGVTWCFWLELATGDIHPVPLPNYTPDADFRSEWPVQAVWSPDGNEILVLAHHNYLPNFDKTAMLIASEADSIRGVYSVDVFTATATLLGYLPADPTPLFTSAWGPENDVIIGNAVLKLARD